MAKACEKSYRRSFLSTCEQGYGTLEELAAEFLVSLGMDQKSLGSLCSHGQHGAACFPAWTQSKDRSRRTGTAPSMAQREARLDAGRVPGPALLRVAKA